MPFAPDPRESFDMALLRMHAFQPQDESAVASPAAAAPVQTRTAAGSAPAGPAPDGPAPDGPAQSRAAVSAPDMPAQSRAAASSPDIPVQSRAAAESAAVERPPTTQAHSGAAVSAQASATAATTAPAAALATAEQSPGAATSPAATSPAATTSDSAPTARVGGPITLSVDEWADTVSQLGLSGMPRQLAANCCLKAHSNGKVSLLLEADSEHLNSPRFCARLEKALGEYIGEAVSLNVELLSEETLEATPAKLQARTEQEELDAARVAIDEDPGVQRLIASVDGAVDADSVRPVRQTRDEP